MFPKQALSATSRRATGILATALLLTACSTSGPVTRPGPVASPPEPAAAAEPLPQTTTEAAVAAGVTRGSGPAGPATVPGEPIVLNPDAPAEYVVKRGDTLWDISAMFLRDPWRWPDIWQVNPQIENPHLIYPGDVLSLVPGVNGGPPGLRLTRRGGARSGAAGNGGLRLEPLLRDSAHDGAIATIPYSAIAAFLERPSVLSKERIRKAARVVGFSDGHMVGGAGIQAYVRGLPRGEPRQRYDVVHVGSEIRDPDGGKVIGYQGIYTATAIVEEAGPTARVALTDTARETLAGDRLVESERNIPLNFVPRAPARRIEGRIVSSINAGRLIGQYEVVVINRGLRHGVEPGHVLAIEEAGETLRDRTRASTGGVRTSGTFAPKLQLPSRRNGTLLVFRSFEQMSYGLVVAITRPVQLSNVVRSP